MKMVRIAFRAELLFAAMFRMEAAGDATEEYAAFAGPAGTPAMGTRLRSKRMILVEPGFTQSFGTRPQIQPHFDGIGTGYREIELGAPVAGHIVRHGLGKNIRKGAARGPKNRLRLHAEGQGRERRA